MKVRTTRFGELEIEDSKVIQFPRGLPGFNELNAFFLLDYSENVRWLQSIDEPHVAFIVSDPFLYFSDYSFVVDDETEEYLEIGEGSDVTVLTILSVTGDRLVANLKAPIVINGTKMRGVQLLLEDDRYEFRTPVPGPVKNTG